MAQAELVEHMATYAFPSALARVKGRPSLALAASNAPAVDPHFFAGRLLQPELAAQLMLAASTVALKRFYLPPAMVARLIRMADPVVTASGDRLRFESLSQCCGVYARADFLAEMLAADVFGKGTTNVDFNAATRAALTKIRAQEDMSLNVSRDGVAVTTARGTAVEHKVKLPVRWLKGFAEVQRLMAGLHHVVTLPGPAARAFLTSMPLQVSAHDKAWLHVSARGVRIGQTASQDAIAVGGLGRLQVLKPLARHALSLRIYGASSGTSAFELEFATARFQVLLSASASRGFSGEGQLLTTLSTASGESALARVRSHLSWQSDLTASRLARRIGIAESAVASALAQLGSQGLVGFDLHDGSYFHRQLPFDMSRIVAHNPRLKQAQTLHESGAVTIKQRDGATLHATVVGTDTPHRVRLAGDDFHCTCIWHARTGGASGPCKHVLAVMMAAQEDTSA